MFKAVSPLVGTVLLVGFAIGVGGLVTLFMTGTTKTLTGVTSNATESLTSCATARIDIPKDSIYCVSGYNLTLLMHFDEGSGTTTKDSSGYGNDGTLTGGPTWSTGKFGNAIEYDGDDDYVNVTHSTSLDVGRVGDSYTVEVWVKVNSLSSAQPTVISKYTSRYPYKFIVSAGNGIPRMETWNGTAAGSDSARGTTNISDGNWHHLVAVRDATLDQLFFYRNGVLESSKTDNTVGDVSNTKNVIIGWRNDLGNVQFNGTIDEVRLYNRALSATEVKQHYESSITGLFGNKSVVKFQLKNNGQYSLGKNFGFALATASASNTTTITLNNDLNVGDVQLVELSNLTLSTLGVSTIQSIHITSVACPNVQLTIKDLLIDC